MPARTHFIDNKWAEGTGKKFSFVQSCDRGDQLGG